MTAIRTLTKARQVRNWIARHRRLLRILLAGSAITMIIDPFVFERSIVHILVGHSVLTMLLLLVLLWVESAESASESEEMAVASRQFVPALGFHLLTPLCDIVVSLTVREHLFKHALVEQAALQPKHRVLDLACGTGTLTTWMAQAHPTTRIAGVDGDPRVLQRARDKARRAGRTVRFDQALAADLPYASDRFDRVVCSLFFHHLSVSAKKQAAQEVFRVLAPGGEVHVADWGKPTGPLMRGAFLIVQVVDGFANTRDHLNGVVIALLADVGFAQVSERRRINTLFGTLCLYSAVKPQPNETLRTP